MNTKHVALSAALGCCLILAPTVGAAQTLASCSALAAGRDVTSLETCLDALPSAAWATSTFVGLSALLDYWQGSIASGDRNRSRYRALRDDETSNPDVIAFLDTLAGARAAAVRARDAELSSAEARGRASAVAEASDLGCQAVISSSGRVAVTGFCSDPGSGGVCIESRELSGLLVERRTFREELDTLRRERDTLRVTRERVRHDP